MSIDVTDTNYEAVLKNSTLPIILDFWAPRCSPCLTLSPILDELAQDYKDQIIIAKINVDDSLKLAMKYSIRSIPTILYIKNGEVVDKHLGSTTKQILDGKIKQKLLQ